jgi:predicted DCC family thiol-disulfide oxidoreductase YuxK
MPTEHLTVWYNTRCPSATPASTGGATSCLRRFARAPSRYGATLDDIRRRLHATDEAARLIVGADVAVALWRMTPGAGSLPRCSAIG